MKNPSEPKRFPAWVRVLGWLGFGVMALATFLIFAHWLVMNSGHQAVRRIVTAQLKKPATHVSAAAVPLPDQAVAHRGISLGSVPYFGAILTGDKKGWKDFSKVLQDMEKFRWHRRIYPELVDGVRSFRGILQNMGTDVPESMTEAEAATEFLKQTGLFSGLLAEWREAVSKGPIDRADDYQSNPSTERFRVLSSCMMSFMQLTGEAHLVAGEPAAAWVDWQTMKNSQERVTETLPLNSYGSNEMDSRVFDLACSGVFAVLWTDDQLSELSYVVSRENALASAQGSVERQKTWATEYYTNFHEHEEEFAKDFMETPSAIDQMFNRVKLKLITEQQIQDNLEVKLIEIDQQLSCFDPDTGYYLQPTEEQSESGESKESAGVLGNFYFMIKNLNGGGDGQWVANQVIHDQSQYDQFRIAAALETYRRQTGSYPDQLDAVSGQFKEGAPRDIATGQPYFYQQNADGGYKIWGTGIDGKSDGGNEKTDVVWKRRN